MPVAPSAEDDEPLMLVMAGMLRKSPKKKRAAMDESPKKNDIH